MGAAIFGGKHGKSAESDVAGRFTGMDALLALKLEDEQAKLNVEELLERHRAAVKHVYEHVYLFAPVKQGTDRFPADSPKAGQRYTWLTLDDKQNFNETKDYPDGVAVDERGNIFVSQRAGMPTRLITADEIKASECVPPAPPPPRLVKTESTRLSVSWQRVVCLVTRYELSWQALDAATGRPGKAGWQEGGAVPASSTAVNARAIENLVCCTPYEVRVRAKNLTGWGEWSDESLLMLTAAGAPGMCPSAVALVRATTTEVELGWPVAPRNGEDIVQYLLQWRGATDPPEDPWREAGGGGGGGGGGGCGESPELHIGGTDPWVHVLCAGARREQHRCRPVYGGVDRADEDARGEAAAEGAAYERGLVRVLGQGERAVRVREQGQRGQVSRCPGRDGGDRGGSRFGFSEETVSPTARFAQGAAGVERRDRGGGGRRRGFVRRPWVPGAPGEGGAAFVASRQHGR